MTNKPKRRYCIRNWADYHKALVRRGSLTLWIEQGVAGRWRDSAAPVRRGRRRFYSDLAITCALTLREVYHRHSLAETAMMRLKTIFSDKLKAREWKRPETELRVRCGAMNRMTSLGMPRSYAL